MGRGNREVFGVHSSQSNLEDQPGTWHAQVSQMTHCDRRQGTKL